MRGAAVVAVVIGLLALGCGAVPDTPDPGDRVDVRVAAEPWIVLVAGPNGMRGRDGFDGADGMLFDLGDDVDPTSVVFVMDGVSLPLDVAWFTESGDLVGVDSMSPCAAEPCPRYQAPAPFRWAIEASPGAFDGLPADTMLTLGQ